MDSIIWVQGASTGEKAGTSSGAMKKVVSSGNSAPKAHMSTSSLSRSNIPKADRGRCYYCNGEHSIGRCPKLEEVAPEDRFGKIKESNLCYNCLTPGHSTRQCMSKHRCQKCNGQHHTILCRTSATTPTNGATTTTKEQSSSASPA